MADGTHIEWCRSADGRRGATWNFITGCSIKSSGCTHCYAMKLAGTRLRHHPSRARLTMDSKAGPVWTGEVRFNAQWLDQPLHWRESRAVFVCAHGDLFHEDVPDEWIDEGFAVMAMAPQHTYQVLTKRSDRMRRYFAQGLLRSRIAASISKIKSDFDFRTFQWPLPNVWLGVSVEDQRTADERIPDLLATHAAVRWISAEPLLGRVSLNSALGGIQWIGGQRGCGGTHAHGGSWEHAHGPGTSFYQGDPQYPHHHHDERCGPGLDWVVAGGESGEDARPMHPDWARLLRDQCTAAGVPFLFKQWGEWCDRHPNWPHVQGHVIATDGTLYRAADLAYPDGPRRLEAVRADHDKGHLTSIYRLGKKRAGRTLDDTIHDAFPVTHHDVERAHR